LAVAGLTAPLSKYLDGALYKYPEWMNKWIFLTKDRCQIHNNDGNLLNKQLGGHQGHLQAMGWEPLNTGW